MSGLYFLGVIALWLWLTGVLVRLGWRVQARKKGIAPNILMVCIILAWFGLSFWYGGGRKFYYDWQVERMCAVDGGVRVYERVELPAERFDKYGNVGIANKRYAKLSDEYYFESEEDYLKKGSPRIVQHKTRVIRHDDQKVIGESIRYGRGGGDMPGPWHPSSYDCPQIKNAEGKLESSIFIKGVK